MFKYATWLPLCTLIAGCVPGNTKPSAPAEGDAHLKSLQIEKVDGDFYHGRYIGTQKDCFPPITKRICRPLIKDEQTYSLDRKLDIEEFKVRIITTSYANWTYHLSELLHLTAAELALQRGYPMYTIITSIDTTSCSDPNYEAHTSGSSMDLGRGDTYYSGRTTISSSSTCARGKSIDVLFFKDKAELEKGVLRQTVTGYNPGVYPVRSLYSGTIPEEDVMTTALKGTFLTVPANAYKVHYDAAGLAKDLRAKFGGTMTQYAFTDGRKEGLKRMSDDPIEKHRVISK
jgi:hypothetical protein